MNDPSRARWRRGPIALIVALFLSAIALRPQIVAIGPLLPQVQADLGLTHSEGGLLATIPLLGMGLFSLVAARVRRRFATDTLVTASLLATAVFGIIRTLAPSPTLLLAGTVGVGAAAGLGGVMLAAVVKERFPHRPAVATGIYGAGIQLGAVVAAGVAVPLADSLGGWRQSLFAISAATFMLAAVWERFGRWAPLTAREAPMVGSALPRRPVMWLLVVVFGGQSVLFYGMNTWLPSYLVSATWTESDAAAALALMNLSGLAANLTVPHLADRVGSRRLYLLGSVAAITCSIQGLTWWPHAGLAWSLIGGVGMGIVFPVALILPLDLHHDPRQVVATTGVMLGGGYMIAAIGPTALGAIRDLTAGFEVVLHTLTVVCVLLAVAMTALSPARLSNGRQPSSQQSSGTRSAVR